MDQAFACPHCRQMLSAPTSMAGLEVQCFYCSGRSIIPVSASAETNSPPTPEPTPAFARASSEDHSPTETGAGFARNRKLIIACAVLFASACLPILLFAIFQLGSASTTVASAPEPPADSVLQPVATPLTGHFVPAAAAAPLRTEVQQPNRPPADASQPSLSLASNAPRTPATAHAPQPAVQPLTEPKSGKASTTELVEEVEPSVVIVDTGDGLGSGFVYDVQGTIITNYHVIEGAKKADIKFADKSSAPVTGFLAVSPGKDLAILRIDPTGRRLKPLKATERRPSKGEAVLAFGAPRGLGSTVSDGIVSSIREGTELRDIFKAMTNVDVYVEHQHYDLDAVWIQTTAPISGGNSGGPLVNLRGEVVGLNTWNRTDGQNLNFAISAEHIGKMMASAQSGLQPLANLPEPREKTFAAGAGQRTLEYWDEVSRINRALASRIKKLRQPPLPTDRKKLLELFPKLAGIYQKLGDWMPETAAKLKNLKIDDVDEELVALVAVDAIYLEKIAEEFRSMVADAKMMQKVTLLDTSKLASKSYGDFQEVDLSAAYDILRIKLTNRYGLTFASILSDAPRGKATAKADEPSSDGEDSDDGAAANAAREKQAAGKLRLAKNLKNAGKLDVARQRLEQIVQEFPGTEAAKEAASMLEELGQ